MKNYPKKFNKGITLIETVITAVISVIIVLAVATLMADSQKGYNSVYEKTFSPVSIDATVARKIFSRTIRQCSKSAGVFISDDLDAVEARYYSNYGAGSVDRYARFYLSGNSVYLENGIIEPRQSLTVEKICDNADSLKFSAYGDSVYMHLYLDNDESRCELNTSAILNAP